MVTLLTTNGLGRRINLIVRFNHPLKCSKIKNILPRIVMWMRLEIKAVESSNETVDYVPRKVTLRQSEFYLLGRSKNKYDGF